MIAPRTVLTYRDYAALPNDGRRYELHEGELSVTPAPGATHQRVILKLVVALEAYVRARRLGEVFVAPFDVILSDTTVVQPDIMYVATDRSARVSERGIEGAPTLAVEILSPSSRGVDRDTKLRLYAGYGVPWYWIVDPESRVVEVYKLAAGSYTLSARVAGDEALSAKPLPDLALPAASLWA